MKRFMIVAGVLAALALAGCGSSTSAVQTVDTPAFLSTTAQPGVVIVDVRTPDEFAAGHLQNAVNINVEDPDFAVEIESLAASGAVVVTQ